ncbi:MAG: leucyl aminopeptidase [Kineosporiaceae bacterium]
MTSLALSAQPVVEVAADALVVLVVPGAEGPALLWGAELLGEPLASALRASLEAVQATGKADAVVRVPAAHLGPWPVVVLSGTGRVAAAPTPEQLRRAVGAATRELSGTGTAAIAVPAPTAEELSAVAEGALLGAYGFSRYRSGAAAKPPLESVVLVPGARGAGGLVLEGASDDEVLARASVLAAAVHATRDLVNTSPLQLYPETFADAARQALADRPVEVTVLDDEALREGGYGGIVAVGQGSARPPRLVHLDYAPAAATTHVALVGKGITFDSGGLSIKPAAGMEAMKSDMAGAAAVLATVAAAARLQLPVRVGGWLALAENMPSGTAQRPSDVITVLGGRTVEVLNTDAEGRLVLADAIVAAGRTQPDLMVDVATLTGAQMVALGNRVSAVMANHDDWRQEVLTAAAEAGEQFWPMPLPAELRASLDSPVADLANIGERFGGMLVAGLFLQEFVPEAAGSRPSEGGSSTGQVPWAHLDIAGPALNSSAAHGYTGKGGTGVAVRTLLRLLERVASR